MTDHPGPDFERQFADRLRQQLEDADRPFDPDAIARTAMAGERRPLGRILIGAATALVAAAFTLFAIQLLAPPGSRTGEPRLSSSAPPPSAYLPTPTVTMSCVPSPNPPPSGSTVDSTGILLVPVGEQIQPPAACDEEHNLAFDKVLRLAMAHPTVFGYPWVDPMTNELVFSVVTDEGRALAEEVGATLTFPYRIRDVLHSYAVLQQIQTDVTYLRNEGVVDAELIFMVVPDHRDNRTMIVISEMSRPLLEELARRFDPDAIAIQVDPNQPRVGY